MCNGEEPPEEKDTAAEQYISNVSSYIDDQDVLKQRPGK